MSALDNNGPFVIALEKYDGTEKSVTVPDGITKIGRRAFSNNRYLQEVVLPDGIIEICEDAFASCVNLERINIPKSVQVIGPGAFKG